MSEPKSKRSKKSKSTEPFPVQTGQEANAMLAAVSDGKSGRHWQTVMGADARVHQVPGAAHRIQLVLTDGERDLGVPVEALESATLQCDADDDFILLYISRLLAPTQALAPNTAALAVVELDDVIKAIGWNPLSTAQRAEMRRRIWHFIRFVARAHIIGQRTYQHHDSMTGEAKDTYIDSPPWMLGAQKREGAPQPSLFEDDNPPLSVEIVATPMWTQLTTLPSAAQFLPLGEVLGAIPGGKPAGAWARVIGLALSNFWRRKPREAMSGKLQPTRRELLERYTPATGPVSDVLNGAKPGRAIEYWAGALRILVDCEFLADDGEAALSYEAQRDALNGYKWQEEWLSGLADVRPGPAMIEAVSGRADALPESKPRSLQKRLKTTRKARKRPHDL